MAAMLLQKYSTTRRLVNQKVSIDNIDPKKPPIIGTVVDTDMMVIKGSDNKFYLVHKTETTKI